VQVADGWYFILPEVQARLSHNASLVYNQHQVHILSPFDNLLIQRKRLAKLFGFNYQIECYLLLDKRQYGYFSLS
jgi:uncharacterized protein YcaQ